ncbi:hypothetical protein FRC07_012382, partial [Ceratobasidium sp. 392]
MAFVPPNEIVESPAALPESEQKRPPMLGLLSEPGGGASTPGMASSPSGSTFETGRTPGSVRFPSTASAPDLSKLGH